MGDKLQSDNCIFTMPTMWKSISNIRHLQFRDTEFQQTEGANRLPSGATIITRNQKDSKLELIENMEPCIIYILLYPYNSTKDKEIIYHRITFYF